MKGVLIRAVLLLLVAAALPAHAAGNMALAKELFQKGQTDFALGKFVDAAQAFEAAYREVPRPELLWNIAKAYRKQYEIDRDIEHLRRARVLYQNYADLVSSAKERNEGREEEAAVEVEIQRAEQAAAGGPSPDGVADTPKTDGSLLPLDKGPSARDRTLKSGSVSAKSKEKSPLYRRWWLWTAVGGAAAAGLGVGLGVGLTRPMQPLVGGFGASVQPGF